VNNWSAVTDRLAGCSPSRWKRPSRWRSPTRSVGGEHPQHRRYSGPTPTSVPGEYRVWLSDQPSPELRRRFLKHAQTNEARPLRLSPWTRTPRRSPSWLPATSRRTFWRSTSSGSREYERVPQALRRSSERDQAPARRPSRKGRPW